MGSHGRGSWRLDRLCLDQKVSHMVKQPYCQQRMIAMTLIGEQDNIAP
jgi:hypothetical protein